MMWHGPAGRCIFDVCKHFGCLYIYMSRHILRSKCVTCVVVFDDDDDDVYVSYML
jgi:hypothetical protein